MHVWFEPCTHCVCNFYLDNTYRPYLVVWKEGQRKEHPHFQAEVWVLSVPGLQLGLLHLPVKALSEVEQAPLQDSGWESSADGIHCCHLKIHYEKWWAEHLSSIRRKCLQCLKKI